LYEQVKEHWLKQLAAHSDNAVVIRNAARYFSHEEPDQAEELFRSAMELQPDEPDWARELAWLLRSAGPDRSQDALGAIKLAILKQPDPQCRYYMLDDWANLAFAAGNFDEAAEAARECVGLAFSFGKDWNDGNAIHNGNCVLGRIAFRIGDTETAKMHLALAGNTPGSPQLNSFGPSMDLARELAGIGETSSVVSYLEACKTFWDEDCQHGFLAKWIEEIKQGQIPDFSEG
jgi:tetratricopeptide (TPR) repeat protein